MKVNRLMMGYYDLSDKDQIPSKKLRKYMYNYLEIITAISSIMAIRSHEQENLDKRDALWADLQEQNPKVWRMLKNGIFGRVLTSHNAAVLKFSEVLYKIAQKVFGFN